MEENQETAITLRDEIANNLAAAMQQAEAPAPTTPEAKPVDAAQEAKQERARDEAGRYAAAQNAKPPSEPQQTQHPARPSSWKKEYDEYWNKFDPKVADYILQREKEYQSGVSTYKAEAENARALNDAIAPFLPNLQKYGMQPTAWIQSLGHAHERLALGSPQEKVMFVAKLLHDYQVDPRQLFSVLSGNQPYVPPQQQQVDINQMLDMKLAERDIKSELQKFLSEAETKYPHYQAVKDDMVRALESKLATDYPSAYEVALRLPKHSELFDRAQKQLREQNEAERMKAGKVNVERARANAVSTRTSSPKSNQDAAQAGNRSLRDEIRENLRAHSSGRI